MKIDKYLQLRYNYFIVDNLTGYVIIKQNKCSNIESGCSDE